MGHLMFYLAVAAACLLWSATFVAAAVRTDRMWLRRLLVVVAVIVPPLVLAPWVAITGGMALMGFTINWFAPTLTTFIAAVVGGIWTLRAGLSRDEAGARPVAAAWPVVAIAAMFVLAKAVAFGTLLFIDNAVAAESRALRVEAAELMAASMPPVPAAADDAAPLYVRAFGMLEADATLWGRESTLGDPLEVDTAAPEVAVVLSRHAATLELLRRAADRSGCRFVRDWSRPSIDMLLPEVRGMRQAARLLTLAARREAAAGDVAAALRDVVRIHRIGVHAAAEPVLICGLVGGAVDATALETLASVLPALDARDLPLLDDVAVRDFLGTPLGFQRHYLGEDAFGLATLADLADGRPGQPAVALVRSWTEAAPRDSLLDGPLSLLYRCFMLPADIAGYRGVMRRYQAVASSMASLPPEPFPALEARTAEIEDDVRLRRTGFYNTLMTPALGGVVKAQVRAEALHRAAEVLVAATCARLQSGALPGAPNELVPDRLSVLPADPFTKDQPLRSKTTDDEWIVYSVGPDGEDDGGPSPLGTDPADGNDDVGLRLAAGR